MGSEVISPTTKQRFDLSMSRRTRKPWSSLINNMHHQELLIQKSQPKQDKEQGQEQEQDQDQDQEQEQDQEQDQDQEQEQEQDQDQEQEQEQDKDQDIDRMSLKNLIRCDQESNGEANNVNNKTSLGQNLEDEEGTKNTLQLVVKKEKQGGVIFKGMMGRYVKVLSGLIKAKRDRKTPPLRFKP